MSNVRRGDELSNTCKNPVLHSPCCRKPLPFCEIQGAQRSSRPTGIRHAKEEPADQCREKYMKSNLNCSFNLFMLLTAISFSTAAAMLLQALRHDGPALVEVTVNRQELSMPPTITLEQMKGFSLFMLKAVLNGRGDEIIDLARTNLFR